MQIQWHGKGIKGFPESGGQFAYFGPGDIKDVPKEWVVKWKGHPFIKPLFIKGQFGGFEFKDGHEKILKELYPNENHSLTERSRQYQEDIERQARFEAIHQGALPILYRVDGKGALIKDPTLQKVVPN